MTLLAEEATMKSQVVARGDGHGCQGYGKRQPFRASWGGFSLSAAKSHQKHQQETSNLQQKDSLIHNDHLPPVRGLCRYGHLTLLYSIIVYLFL